MHPIYLKKDIKTVDNAVAQHLGVSSFELMKKAAAAVFSYVQHQNKILVVTGAGNNAGDGYLIALLALQAGIDVQLWNLKDCSDLPEDAQKAANNYLQSGGQLIKEPDLHTYDCIIDAILGTGINREVSGPFAHAITWINQQNTMIVAVDVPSGLDADVGTIRGCAIKADLTICIICHKAGLLTNHGKDHTGTLYLADLGVPICQQRKVPTSLTLLNDQVLNTHKRQRLHNSHKGTFGHVMLVGGQPNMLGAIILAARAALRSGCGVVETVSQCPQVVTIPLQCPELLTCKELSDARLLLTAKVIGVGPGLGTDAIAKHILMSCLEQNKPMVIDADALNLIAQQYHFDNNRIRPIQLSDDVVLTPHPKEAAKLLNCSTQDIQANRISAAKAISQRYRATVVLKGSGTVICGLDGHIYICPFGYGGMATAGMGDVLTGIISGLMAQGFSALEAAKTGVVLHAKSAEYCQKGNGLMASDVIEALPSLVAS